MPQAADLRENVIFYKKIEQNDDYGNTESDWAEYCRRKAKLVPTALGGVGRETVLANRLTGTAVWDCIIYKDEVTKYITTDYKAADQKTGKEFNIRFVGDIVGNDRFLTIQLQEGVAV